jgi:uncharacterized spore protein YtfJ
MARSRPSAVFERLARRIGGGRLVYAKPLRVGDRAIIPVSRVRAVGGFGFGDGTAQAGGGGGGVLDARPVGFIDVGPDGARYETIPQPRGRAIATGVAAGALVGTAVVGTVLGTRAVTRLGRAALPSARRAVRWSSRRGRLPLPRR